MSKLHFNAVSKPGGSSYLQGINIKYGDSTVLHFSPKTITNSAIIAPDKFMSSVNRLLSNFSEGEHRDLLSVYQAVKDVYENPVITHTEIFELNDAMEKFFDIITLERIQAWGRDNEGDGESGTYVLATSIGNIQPMRDGSVSHSCTREEYLDICILSTLFKMLIPFQTVVAHIEPYVPNLVDCDYWGMFQMLNSAGNIEDFPAYQQLLTKAAAKAEVHIGKDVPTGLTAQGVGAGDYHKIILIPKLFRDVVRLETEVGTLPNDTNNNISYKINMSIENRIKIEIKRDYQFGRPRGTDGNDEDGGNTTMKERTVGGERYSSLYGMVYAQDYEDFMRVMIHTEDFPEFLKVDSSSVEEIVKKFPPRSEMSDAQSSVVGNLFNEVIPIDADIYRPPSAGVKMRAYAALIARKLDLPNIEAFMLSDVSESQFSESETRNSTLRTPIVHPDFDKVLDLYEPEDGGHPFTESIERLVHAMVRNNYTISIPHREHEMGEEWYPKIINDRSIKDEFVELFGILNGVIDRDVV